MSGDSGGQSNDFLIAPDEGDLKPDVVKRFEEMVAQAQQSAGAAAGNAQQTAQDVAAAAGYARAAEQAKNDIDAALTGTLKTANHLSEIAAAGEKAQQKSRDSLGLKRADSALGVLFWLEMLSVLTLRVISWPG